MCKEKKNREKRKGIKMNESKKHDPRCQATWRASGAIGVYPSPEEVLARERVNALLAGKAELVIEGRFHFQFGFNLFVMDAREREAYDCEGSFRSNAPDMNKRIRGIISIGDWIQLMTLTEYCQNIPVAEAILKALKKYRKKNPERYASLAKEICWAKQLPLLSEKVAPDWYRLRSWGKTYSEIEPLLKRLGIMATFGNREYTLYDTTEEDRALLEKELEVGYSLTPTFLNSEILGLLESFEEA